MCLIIALGSNIGDRQANLETAISLLEKQFTLVKASSVIETDPVDYLEQPAFLNQVVEFKKPENDIKTVFSILKQIEMQMGRNKTIPKGPRNIDLDLIFWGLESYCDGELEVPHPRAYCREFVMEPLKELPSFERLKKQFKF